MESEKVKKIKKALKCCINLKEKCDNEKCYLFDKLEYHYCERQLKTDILTLINELESENERLNKSDTLKEESSIEYYNLYKDLKRKNKDLNELCELQRVSIAESFVRENQLKDRIAELEKENARGYADGIKNTYEVVVPDKLEAFAKWLSKRSNNLIYIELVEKFIKECL